MSMSERQLVAIPCRLSLGGFSGERIFEVVLANGEKYRGAAPRHFCWDDQGNLVGAREPASEGPGWVAARVVDQLDDGQVLVEVPDEEVIAVEGANVRDRPTPIRPPEPKSHVPVGS
jgi:hypothetical protein